jgi:macrolide transport system ATP-binding/permease protein
VRPILWLTDFLADARYAIRSLGRTPGLSAIVVMTLALGIGMTTTPFSMLDVLIFRPYPVPNPASVVNLVSTARDNSFDNFSYREYLDIRDKAKSYDGVVAHSGFGPVAFSAEPGGTPLIRGGMIVSGNYFRALGVEPQFGRSFRDDEDTVPGRDAVVVLGPDIWKVEFGSDPSVVGKRIRLNGTDFTVIGVAPDTFTGMQNAPSFVRLDFYLPLAMARVFATNPQKNFFEDRDDRQLQVKARLKAGTSLPQARSELALLTQDFAREFPHLYRDRGANARTQFEMRTRDDNITWKFSVIFTILALAVLLVACTNVAGLLLSRGRTRTREIAVRLALGAGRLRLMRMLLTESLILACAGGLAGIAVGYAGIRFLRAVKIPTEFPVSIPFAINTRVLLASLAVSAVSAFVFGVAPALQSTRTNLVDGLKTADIDLAGRKRLWGRNLLVVAQVAMSLMLLTASFLMARSFRTAVLQGTGFAKDHLLMAKFDPRLVQYSEDQTQRFYKLLVERARSAPGVQSTALTQNPPLGLDRFDVLAFVPDRFDMPRDRENFTSAMDTVDEGFFEALGIPVVRGRAFRASDTADTPRVAIVNEHFAKHYWPDADAVGQRIRLGTRTGTAVEIIGVAPTLKYRGTTEMPTDFVYLPLTQHPVPRMVLLLRSSGDPLQLVTPVKDVVRTLDPNMPVLETRSYDDLYRYQTVEGPGVAIELVGTLGAVGLLLAVGGLYGVVAYNVSRRTREIGIRMAIGAGTSDVLRLVMSKGLMLVSIGTVIGLVMGIAVERLMNSLMFNAGGVDLATYAIVVPSMFLVTMLAAYVPARRAARIAPTRALRYE